MGGRQLGGSSMRNYHDLSRTSGLKALLAAAGSEELHPRQVCRH
jgi:hypothetical protein